MFNPTKPAKLLHKRTVVMDLTWALLEILLIKSHSYQTILGNFVIWSSNFVNLSTTSFIQRFLTLFIFS